MKKPIEKAGFSALVILALVLPGPLAATEFSVVSAVGVVEPAGLAAGQLLDAGTKLALEPWGRAVVRETSGCALTHVVVGVEEYSLEASESCEPNQDPLALADRVQQGESFTERVKEEEGGAAATLVAALSLNPCVFLLRVSEEPDNRRECPSGYGWRGLRCSGSYCDDKDLMCCPYLGGESDPGVEEIQARQISEEFPNTMKSKHFLNGLTCWGPYCDNVAPRAFKSPAVTNTKTCEWSPWNSERPAAWIDCGDGRFVAGLRCRDEYCGDLGLYCCQAKTP